MILPDLCIGNLLRLVLAAVSEACCDLQVLIIYAGCTSCCPREFGIKRAVIDVAAARRQTFRAGIPIPCPCFLVIQRKIIEGKRIVIETVALPKRKGIVFPFYGILPIDGDLRRDLAIIAYGYHAGRIRIFISGNVKGYIRTSLQVVAVIPFRIDLVDNTALLDVLHFAVVVAGVGNLIFLRDLNAVSSAQRGGIAVITAVVACRNIGIPDFYLTVNDVILEKIVKCACVSIFVSKSPYSILFAAEIGCQLRFTEAEQVGDMPAIVSRECIDTDLLLIPVCRTVYLSVFIFAEDLDHHRATRGSITAVDPGLVKVHIHVLAIAATVGIVVRHRNGFNEVCPAGIILGKGIVEVMAGVIIHLVDKVSVTGRILVIQRQNNVRIRAAPVFLVCTARQLACISLFCICQSNPRSVMIQNLFFSIRIYTVNRILNRGFLRLSEPYLAQHEPDRAAQRIRDLRDSGFFRWIGTIYRTNVCDLIRVEFTAAVLDGKSIPLIQRTILSSRGNIAAFADFVRHIGIEMVVFIGHRQIREGCSCGQVIVVGKPGDTPYQCLS